MIPVDFFKCLSDQTRLDIVLLVLQNERCVCELTDILNLSQPKISRHLALLRTARLLLDRKQGQWVYYRINPDLPPWCQALLQTTEQQLGQPFKTPDAVLTVCCE